MSGVKGRSGGARVGAGRKPSEKPQTVVIEGEYDMLEMLQKIALGHIEVTPLQLRAAIAAVQYTHTKRSDGGKKEEKEANAKRVAGKFASAAPPLRVVSK